MRIPVDDLFASSHIYNVTRKAKGRKSPKGMIFLTFMGENIPQKGELSFKFSYGV